MPVALNPQKDAAESKTDCFPWGVVSDLPFLTKYQAKPRCIGENQVEEESNARPLPALLTLLLGSLVLWAPQIDGFLFQAITHGLVLLFWPHR